MVKKYVGKSSISKKKYLFLQIIRKKLHKFYLPKKFR
jgi:hypothetical protein